MGYSIKNLYVKKPLTINNPGGDWVLCLDNGDYEDSALMAAGFITVADNDGSANFSIEFDCPVRNPSGYYFMTGVDASQVSVALSGYSAANFGEYIGLVETTELPFGIATKIDNATGNVEQFIFYESLAEVKRAMMRQGLPADETTVYVLNYYNTSSDVLVDKYNCYSSPGSFNLQTVFRTTDGTHSSFYLYKDGVGFVEQYNNGDEISISPVQTHAAILNCYTLEGPRCASNPNEVSLTDTWTVITGSDENLSRAGAYLLEGGNFNISKAGKYTVVADKCGTVNIIPEPGVNGSDIKVNIVGRFDELNIGKGVFCRVGFMEDYPDQTMIKIISNSGILAIKGHSTIQNADFQTDVEKIVNFGTLRVYEDTVVLNKDVDADYIGIDNRQGGAAFLESVIVRLAGGKKDTEIVGIKNQGSMQIIDSRVSIENDDESCGIALLNEGGDVVIGKPEDEYCSGFYVDKGYGIINEKKGGNIPYLTIYSLYCHITDDYNGASAGIKSDINSRLEIKSGNRIDDGETHYPTVEIVADGDNSYGIQLAKSASWSIEGSIDSAIIKGGKAALKAYITEDNYWEKPIRTGIYVCYNAESPFDLTYDLPASQEKSIKLLIPETGYYFDMNNDYYYGYEGVAVRNAEAELSVYLKTPIDMDPFVLPCDIYVGSNSGSWIYGSFQSERPFVINGGAHEIDFNGHNIYVNYIESVDCITVYDGSLKLSNSSETESCFDGGFNSLDDLVYLCVWNESDPVFITENVSMMGAEYDVYSGGGGQKLGNAYYANDFSFDEGQNIIEDGLFLGTLHDYTEKDDLGSCLVLKGGRFAGKYMRHEYYDSEYEIQFEYNNIFAANSSDTTALIPYGYELNAYDEEGKKIKTISTNDLKTEVSVVTYPGAYSNTEVLTHKSISLDFTLGGTAYICKLEKKAEPYYPPYIPSEPSAPVSRRESSQNDSAQKEPAGAAVETKPAIKFTDVKKGKYYEEAVTWAVENNITNGTGKTTFSPNNLCTRSQSVSFLFRAACGASKSELKEKSFVDVVKGSYYEEAVLWATENEITKGINSTHFSPETPCTREMFVTMLYRTACILDPDAKKLGEESLAAARANAESAFGDVPKGSYAEEAICWAKAAGVTEGIGASVVNGKTIENSFGYGLQVNRAQAITFLYRYFN